MIIGIGNDLIEIDRVKKIMEGKVAEKFIQRILTPVEQKLAKERNGKIFEFISGRFAAKEAIVKALGCGIGSQISFQDMEIIPDAKGRPICKLNITALKSLGLDQKLRVHISITHSEKLASAFALIEKEL